MIRFPVRLGVGTGLMMCGISTVGFAYTQPWPYSLWIHLLAAVLFPIGFFLAVTAL